MFMSMLTNKFQCTNKKCRRIFSEYINGCPSCATGEAGGSHSVNPIGFGTGNLFIAKLRYWFHF